MAAPMYRRCKVTLISWDQVAGDTPMQPIDGDLTADFRKPSYWKNVISR